VKIAFIASVFPISLCVPNITYRLIGSYWKTYRLRGIYPRRTAGGTAAWPGPVRPLGAPTKTKILTRKPPLPNFISTEFIRANGVYSGPLIYFAAFSSAPAQASRRGRPPRYWRPQQAALLRSVPKKALICGGIVCYFFAPSPCEGCRRTSSARTQLQLGPRASLVGWGTSWQ
jgi:hypothetical protein